MTDHEIRLKCLELAMEQAKRENAHGSREEVAKIATQFYHHVTATSVPEQPASVQRGKPGKDKSPEIFK